MTPTDGAATKNFKRKEKKYLLNGAGHAEILRRLAPYMEVDQYGKSTVSSIYYDTPDFELINRSIEKPVYKEKFRVRCYGTPDEKSPVFAEIKKKYDGIVYKRRVSAPLGEMRMFLAGKQELNDSKQIQNEIQWMLRRYGLRPQVLIACSRTAYKGIQDPELRITFDTDLRYRTERLDLALGSYGTPFMPEDFCIMEIKFPGSAPLWLSHMLDEMQIYPGSFSKIGTCFQMEIAPRLYNPGVDKIRR